ncbi:hypothetical protein GLYMA_16G075900v4 [Glycine max]|uniref:Uncharacterized protein n=1 Tax=Glycine max TaxID=3847 RepID=K7MFS3_SOYBN|nr:hypothetical protein JHK84_044768 [Glycine max]KAH1150414.1 hypothetical protein GYH30_044428 [Glycine max]KRH07238.1 hypothetical protein GLYMA_16G075900v4 [Glycine max]
MDDPFACYIFSHASVLNLRFVNKYIHQVVTKAVKCLDCFLGLIRSTMKFFYV